MSKLLSTKDLVKGDFLGLLGRFELEKRATDVYNA